MAKFKIQEFIKETNNIFIKIILFVFYFFIIGLGSIIYKIFKPKQNKTDSYWQDSSPDNFNLDYFKSAY